MAEGSADEDSVDMFGEVIDSDIRGTILTEFVNAKTLRAQLSITRTSATMAGSNGRRPRLPLIVRKMSERGGSDRRTDGRTDRRTDEMYREPRTCTYY